jgi:hypothetical protein
MGAIRTTYTSSAEIRKGKEHLGDLDINGSITLELMAKIGYEDVVGSSDSKTGTHTAFKPG